MTSDATSMKHTHELTHLGNSCRLGPSNADSQSSAIEGGGASPPALGRPSSPAKLGKSLKISGGVMNNLPWVCLGFRTARMRSSTWWEGQEQPSQYWCCSAIIPFYPWHCLLRTFWCELFVLCTFYADYFVRTLFYVLFLSMMCLVYCNKKLE